MSYNFLKSYNKYVIKPNFINVFPFACTWHWTYVRQLRTAAHARVRITPYIMLFTLVFMLLAHKSLRYAVLE